MTRFSPCESLFERFPDRFLALLLYESSFLGAFSRFGRFLRLEYREISLYRWLDPRNHLHPSLGRIFDCQRLESSELHRKLVRS